MTRRSPGELAVDPHDSTRADTLSLVAAQVIDVELDREHELRVTYDDDVTCTFPLLPLRRTCPCATCRGRREAGDDAYAGSSISAIGAEMHGNWGISISWSDGHSTGIYPWTHLRSWWDAGLDGEGERAR